MATLDVIRTLTVRAKTEGVDQARTSITGLGEATDSSARRMLSQEAALARLERQYVAGAKQAQEFERIQRQLNIIMAQQPQLLEQANAVLAAAAVRLGQTVGATDKLVAGMSSVNDASLKMVAGMTAAGQAANKMTISVAAAAEASLVASQKMIASMSAIGKTALDSSIATQKLTAGLSAAGQQAALPRALDRIATGMTEATNSSRLMVQGMSAFGTRAEATAKRTDQWQSSTKAARFELLNLSRQIQDVGVGLTSGQAIFTVLIQQGSQIVDVFQSASLSGRNLGAAVLAVFTPIRILAGGLLGVGAAAITAAFQWGSAQRDIQVAVRGMGAASGATVADINKIAEATTSITGASISELRDFSSSLAATGRIGVKEIGDLARLGKSFSQVFGVDVAEAGKKVADLFSGNLAAAATELNNRLGSFDAATIKNIRNLQQQGNVLGAQRALMRGLASGLADAQVALSTSTAFWTALGNAISNAFTKFGEFAAKTTGIGLTQGISDQIATVTERIKVLESIRVPPGYAAKAQAVADALTKEKEKLAELTAQYTKSAEEAARSAQARRDSIKAAEAISAQVPETGIQEELQNSLRFLLDIKRAVDDGTLSLEAMGKTAEDLAQAIARAANASVNAAGAMSDFQRASEANSIALKAAGAQTTAAKGQVEFERSLGEYKKQNMSIVEATVLAEQRRGIVLKENAVASSDEAARRKLSSDQALASAKLEIDIMGKTRQEQTLARLNLETYQQLQTAAAAKHESINKAELKALQDQNVELAKLIEQRRQLEFLADLVGDFANTLVQGMLEGRTATDALAASLRNLGQSITSSSIKDLGTQAVKSLTGTGGLLSGIAGSLGTLGGPLVGAAVGIGASLIGSLFDDKASKEQQQVAQSARDAMDQANKSLQSVTESFREFTSVASGPVTSSIKDAQRQFASLQTSAKSAIDAANVVVNTAGNTAAQMAAANSAMANARQAVADANMQLAEFYTRTVAAGRLALRGQEELTTTQQAVKDLADRAKDLQEAMILAGTSAEEAARAVGEDLVVGMNRLRASVETDLLRKINEATGRGFVNQANDLLQEAKDALNLGVNGQTVAAYIAAQAQAIVDGARLTGQAFQDFISQFPEFAGTVHEYTEALDEVAETLTRTTEEIANARLALEDRLFAALNDTTTLEGQLAAFDRQAQREREEEIRVGGENIVMLETTLAAERQRVIDDFNRQAVAAEKQAAKEREDAINQSAKNIVDYVNGLFAGGQAGGSPTSRLAAAQSTYSATLALAQQGNLDAQNRITEDAENLRVALRDLYGSTQQYQTGIQQISSDLLGLPAAQQTTDPVVQAIRDSIVEQQAIKVNTADTVTTTSGTTSEVASGNAIVSSQTGILSAIDAATAATNANTASANTLASSANSLLSAANSLTASSNSFLDAINSLLGVTNSLLSAVSNQTAVLVSLDTTGLQTNYLGTINQVLGDANSGLAALKAVSSHMFAPSGSLNFQLAGGGLVGVDGVRRFDGNTDFHLARGGPVGTDTVNAWLTPGEYVVNKNSTARFRPLLEMMNGGYVGGGANDNGMNLVAEIKALRNDMMRGFVASSEHVREGVEGVKQGLGSIARESALSGQSG